jgi:hypothetical protein
MNLFDLKAGMNPHPVRIFVAEQSVDIPRVDCDMQAGRIDCRPFEQ